MLNKEQVKKIQKRILSGSNRVPRVFSVLGDPSRWRIFHLLVDEEGLCVSDLAHILGVSVPAVSQQLRIMEMAGLVRKERMGQMICYRIERGNATARMVVRLAKLLTEQHREP